jgi:creatinine amidohydrolase/Fe(II)-dependent formamide hydrolase-like protein
MRFDLMRPHQIRDAISRNLPVLLPLGVMEYHGEHMGVGMDLLAVTRVLDRLEREAEVVILPPFAYGAASYAVEARKARGRCMSMRGRSRRSRRRCSLGCSGSGSGTSMR